MLTRSDHKSAQSKDIAWVFNGDTYRVDPTYPKLHGSTGWSCEALDPRQKRQQKDKIPNYPRPLLLRDE